VASLPISVGGWVYT